VLAVVVLATMIGVPSSAFAHSQWNERAWIQNEFGLRCLVVQYLEQPAFVWDCNRDFGDQRWSLQDFSDSYHPNRWRIQNWHDSRICLAVRGTQNGNRAVGVQCDARYADQFWAIYDRSPGHSHLLANYNSGKCLVAQGDPGSPPGAPAFQYDCNLFWADQHWYMYQP
jgi:hypothetical protein